MYSDRVYHHSEEQRQIHTLDQLRVLKKHLWRLRLADDSPDFDFSLAQLSEQQNQQLGEQVNRYKNECGCFLAGLLMGVSVLLMLIHFFISYGFADIGIRTLLTFAGLLVSAALSGKLLAMLWARLRLINVVNSVLVEYRHMEQMGEDYG